MRWWDLQAIAALERVTYVHEPWSPESFWGELAAGHSYFVDEESGSMVGYAGLAVIQDEGYIQTVAVDPAHRGSGRGSLLVDRLLAAAKARGARTVGLEVASRNDSARRIYLTRGFTEVGLRRGYYVSEGDDAVLMSVTL